MTQIILSNNQVALVDDADYERLNQRRWHFSLGYAKCNPTLSLGKGGLMHRILLNLSSREDIDHINGNKLDNRRSNLRVCSRSDNLCNSKPHKDNACGYKGVYQVGARWRAMIMVAGARVHIGMYDSCDEAAKAYDNEAVRLNKQFAKTNFKREEG
jgi:hypothetical protein